jgi:uncharacterized protein YfiM (DUF2279 family)
MQAVLFLVLGLLVIPDEDKRQHFIAGAATAEIGRQIGFTPLQSCIASLGMGIAKEAWDSTGRGHVEFNDALATAAGCGITFRF